jgi:RNA polymerase sigma-70 factor (ECF subfamily)
MVLRARAATELLRSGHVDEGLDELTPALAKVGLKLVRRSCRGLLSASTSSAAPRCRRGICCGPHARKKRPLVRHVFVTYGVAVKLLPGPDLILPLPVRENASVGTGTEVGDDQQARFTLILQQNRPALEAVARRLSRNAAEASDLVQDTCERAFRHLAALKDEARARAWLVQILRNCYLDVCRRRREIPVADVPEPVPQEAEPPSRWQRVTSADLRRAIAELPEPFRDVAVLHDVDGLSTEQISARLGIPYATAATRLHRAHQRVKDMLRAILDEGEDAP